MSQADEMVDLEEFTNARMLAVSLVLHRPEWIPLPNETEAERRKRELIKRQKRAAKKKALAEASAKNISQAKVDSSAGKDMEQTAAVEDSDDDEAPHVDVANILRGGYPKAKFLAEPAETGKDALGLLGKSELDFSVVPLEIPEAFVKSISDETEWTVLSGKHGARTKMTQMGKLLRRKDQELSELEAMLNSATKSIQQFHLQQKQLFDEFVSLRSTYDNTKAKLRESIWVHTARMSREFTVIPPLLQNAVEDFSQIEHYALGGVIGKGESSVVKSCKIGKGTSKSLAPGGGRKAELIGGVSRSGLAKRDLAVKIINKNRVQDVASLQRVANEIRVLREASNVNIMALYDVIHTELKLYMVMERGDRDLYTVIKQADQMDRTGRKGGRVEEKLVQEVMNQILKGISYIHGMHVCHRDLKPENVVLVEKPGAPKPIVKIIDFGSCASSAGGATLLDLCGTPGFLPPEMIMEDSYDGFLGDVWSIGAIALEMVLGYKMFSEIWLPAYAEEMVGSRKAFAMQMADTLPNMRSAFKKRVKHKLASAASMEAICGALMVNPRKRMVIDDLFVHRWVGGKREPSAKILLGGNVQSGSGNLDASTNVAPDSGSKELENPDIKQQASLRENVAQVDSKSHIQVVSMKKEGRQMRRSISLDNLKREGGLAKMLVNPAESLTPMPTPSKSTGSHKEIGTLNSFEDSAKPPLGIDTLLANQSRRLEPGSPAITDAENIVRKGDAILHTWVVEGASGDALEGVGEAKDGRQGVKTNARDSSPLSSED